MAAADGWAGGVGVHDAGAHWILEKMKKLTRAFLREDRARGKHWRLENHCERAAKCPKRVPSASGGYSGWVFRCLTVSDQKMTEGKNVGDVPMDVFELKNFSGADGGGRRAPKWAGGRLPVWNGRVGYQLVWFDVYVPKMKIKLKNDEKFGTYVQKIKFFEVGKICENCVGPLFWQL